MRIRINAQNNGFRNGALLARDLLGSAASEASLGGWQEAIAWIGGSFDLDPTLGKWTTPNGDCTPLCTVHGGERLLQLTLHDKHGFTTAKINAYKYLVVIDIEPWDADGTFILEQLDKLGATIKFGAAA